MSLSQQLIFSLVLPCYNESSHISFSIREIVEVMDSMNILYEIILIDDKSQDDTKNLIKKIEKTYPHIRIFFHDKNMGRGATVTDGILKARGNIVGFIDVDLEVSPVYIPHFVKLMQKKQTDVLIARRYYPFKIWPLNALFRGFMSRSYVWLANKLLNINIDDTEAGYKFFNKKKILPILSLVQDKHWFWDTEIVVRSIRADLKVHEVPVLFLKNPQKDSTVRIIPDTIAYLKAICRFRKDLKHGIKK